MRPSDTVSVGGWLAGVGNTHHQTVWCVWQCEIQNTYLSRARALSSHGHQLLPAPHAAARVEQHILVSTKFNRLVLVKAIPSSMHLEALIIDVLHSEADFDRVLRHLGLGTLNYSLRHASVLHCMQRSQLLNYARHEVVSHGRQKWCRQLTLPAVHGSILTQNRALELPAPWGGEDGRPD